MKKRFAAALLSLAMALTLVTPAFARYDPNECMFFWMATIDEIYEPMHKGKYVQDVDRDPRMCVHGGEFGYDYPVKKEWHHYFYCDHCKKSTDPVTIKEEFWFCPKSGDYTPA